MKKTSLFVLLSLLLTPLFLSAQYYDNQWIFGYDDDYSLKFGLSQLDFSGSKVDLSYYGPVGQKDYTLNFAGSFLCNKNGQLKFHTNNCAVYDSLWNRISGAGVITPTGEGAQNCGINGPWEANYGCLQSSLLLPDLLDSTITYVLHKDMVIDFGNQDVYTENLYFSIIHEENDGTFIFETKYTINSGYLDLENLTAIPNKAKDAWWVLLPRQNSNVFERFLIKSDTVYIRETQEIGLPYISVEVGIGQAQYSPGGKYFAINTENYGV